MHVEGNYTAGHRMDVNVHAVHAKPTGSRLIGFADFVGIARRFIVGRVMGGDVNDRR